MKKILPILSIVMFSIGMMPQEFNYSRELEASETSSSTVDVSKYSYTINDTGQTKYYDNNGEISAPKAGQNFYGQDAHYKGNQMSFRDNGDGTVTDLNTGLVWQQTPPSGRYQWGEAITYANNLTLGGKSDWRLPSIKELVSIVVFSGSMTTKTPYIDTDYFDFEYPDGSDGARDMDAQYWSSNKYLGTVMRGDTSAFGFNFADGRIKAYPVTMGSGGTPLGRYVRCVRGGSGYGENNFVDNGDGTISDLATGLMWTKTESESTMNWMDALEYAENLEVAGYGDWRLPNAKELQSIVDYSRAPDAANAKDRGPAIDPIFTLTDDESWCWTGTTLGDNIREGIYLCFGIAYSADYWNGSQINAHGAGALRSDPKDGNPANYANGRGPQADEVRIYNYVRCVRDIGSVANTTVDLKCADTRVIGDDFEAGDKITMRAKITNAGSAKSLATTVSWYLSPKKTVTNRAVLMGSKNLKALATGSSKWLRLRTRIPGDFRKGVKYIVTQVDENGVNADTNTSNNSASDKIRIY